MEDVWWGRDLQRAASVLALESLFWLKASDQE